MQPLPPDRLIHRFRRRVLLPHTRMGKIAAYFLGLAFVFRMLAWLAHGTEPAGMLEEWQRFFQWASLFLLAALALRWMRQNLLWRLRNRLVVTYLFVGLAPVVLLLTLAVISADIFAGQFAAYLADSRIENALAELNQRDHLLSVQVDHAISHGEDFASLREVDRDDVDTAALWGGQPLPIASSTPPNVTVLPSWLKQNFKGIVVDDGKLAMLCSETRAVKGVPLTVVENEEITRAKATDLAEDLGELTFSPASRINVSDGEENNGTLMDASGMEAVKRSVSWPTVRGGSLPGPVNRLDRVVTFIAPMPVSDWQSGAQYNAILLVTTRPSLLYARLFAASVLAGPIRIALMAVSVAFGIIEILALLIAGALTRSMTRSVANLYHASEQVNRGDLTYRIAVQRNDQLAALEKSFNSMSGSLQRLLIEQKEKERLESELAIAQEVQETLFPTHSQAMDSLDVYGFCKPARRVSGDYYDFLVLGQEKLGIAIGDVSGKGISAALLMATIHSAVRAYQFGQAIASQPMMETPNVVGDRRSDSPMTLSAMIESPAKILSLLNRHLFRSTQPEKYATLFLAVYDGGRRTLTYANGGHLPPFIAGDDGTIRKLEVSGTVIGLFDNASYEDRVLELNPGDILVAFSDGMIEPENEFGEFGEDRLVELIIANRHMELNRICNLTISTLLDWIGSHEQPDDCTFGLGQNSISDAGGKALPPPKFSERRKCLLCNESPLLGAFEAFKTDSGLLRGSRIGRAGSSGLFLALFLALFGCGGGCTRSTVSGLCKAHD